MLEITKAMNQIFERKSKFRDIPSVAVFLLISIFLVSGVFIFESVFVGLGTLVVSALVVAIGIRLLFYRYRNWWTEIDVGHEGINVHYPRQNIFFPLPESLKSIDVSHEVLEFGLEWGEHEFRLLPTDFLKKTELIAALDSILDLRQLASDGTTSSAGFADVIKEVNRPVKFSPRVAVIIVGCTVVYFTTFLLGEMISPNSGLFIFKIATVLWIIGLVVGIAIGVRHPEKRFGIIKRRRRKSQHAASADARSSQD